MMIKYLSSMVCILFIGIVFGQTTNPKIEAVVQRGHTKPITCSDFSPNGQFVATGSIDNTVILWDLKYGKQIKSFNDHLEAIIDVKFSHDSKRILTTSKDNTIKLIDVISGDVLQNLTFEKGAVYHASFSYNDQYIIGFDKRDGVMVWLSENGKHIGTFNKDYALDDPLGLISPDGEKILSKVNNKTVACLSLVSLDTLFTLPFDKAYQMQFSQDGTFIIISSAKLFAQRFNATTGQLLTDFKSDSEQPCDGCNTRFSMSHNSNYLFTMSNKLDGILWHAKTGKLIKKFGTIERRPSNIAFSHDDRYLLLSFDQNLVVYDIKTGQEKLNETNKWIGYYQFKFSPQKPLIILPGQYNTAQVWDVSKGRVVKILKGYLNEQKADGLNLDYTNRIDQHILKYISYKSNVSIAENSRHLVIGKVDSSAVVFDMYSGRRLAVLDDESKAIFCHDYSADGKWLATAGGDQTIRIYDTENYELRYELKGHRALIFDLKFSENGEEIVSGSWDATIRVWTFKSETLKQTIDLGEVSPYLVRYSPNDLYILSGDLSKKVQFWEFDSRTNFRSLIGHTNTISGMEFSKDQRHMVTSSWDGNIKVWDVLTGMLIGKMTSTKAPVYSVIYSASGQSILSGGGDRNIRIWAVKNGQLTAVLKGHTSAVTGLAMSADGQFLVSRAANGEVKVWDYKLKKELYTYLQINQNDWLVKSPEGYFDGSKNALSLVNYVSGVEVVSISALFDKYYTPNLVSRIMKGEVLNDAGESLNHLLKDRPELAFNLPDLNLRSIDLKSETPIESKTNKITVNIEVVENGKSIAVLRLYNNGKLIENENSYTNLVFRSATTFQKSFEIDLVDGVNQIKAVAVSTNGIESSPIYLNLVFNGESAKTDLFILAIGINKYKNSAYNLSYAVKDANDFTEALVKGGGHLFNEVYEYSLNDGAATKAEIKAVFEDLKTKIGPEDVFVFYYAGHGVMTTNTEGQSGDFYIVTHDILNLYGNDVAEKGVSATELMAYSKAVSAQKQLFILDACHSGAALNTLIAARGGDGRAKTLAQLARNTGTFFLTASQDIQFANEAGDLKHGLFTYALLEILKGEYYSAAIDGKITINEMKTYVEERVPELSEQYHGTSQYPTSYSFGQDFPIVILK